jgi:hypothetical protein
MNKIINQTPYLKTSRKFPYDNPKDLSLELNVSYIDIANAVNRRIIGLFSENFSAVTGENWYFTALKSQGLQGLRKVFTFTSTASINHGIDLKDVDRFVRCWGTYTDGTNWYGITFGSSIATTTPGLITFYISPTQIVFLSGAGVAALTSGTIVLEWLSHRSAQ